MTDTVFTSIISIASVLVSVTVSVIISRSQYKAELEKIRRQLEQEYAKSLFEKRVETYPQLYNLLSGYGKIIQYGKQNTKNLINFRNEVDQWNSKNGIFFTRPTARLSGRFRAYLKSLLMNGAKSKIKPDDWEAIKNIIQHFERSIRTEIGVLNIEPASKTDIVALGDVYKYIDERIEEKNSL